MFPIQTIHYKRKTKTSPLEATQIPLRILCFPPYIPEHIRPYFPSYTWKYLSSFPVIYLNVFVPISRPIPENIHPRFPSYTWTYSSLFPRCSAMNSTAWVALYASGERKMSLASLLRRSASGECSSKDWLAWSLQVGVCRSLSSITWGWVKQFSLDEWLIRKLL